VREGIEDYEYLVMLRDRLAELRQAGLESPQIEAAEQLLREAPQRVVPSYSPGDMAWKTPKDRSVADQVRVEILRTLETLAGMGEG
jgi:hypothetical protein